MSKNEIIAESARLRVRRITHDDAPFMLALLNDPSFRAFIGDRGVRTLDDARQYISDRMLASYATHGYGMYAVTARPSDDPLGICGLVRRDTLPEPDLGFAFLPAHWGQGHAVESASLVLTHARDVLGLLRVAAIVKPDNAASIRVLDRLGFRLERQELELLYYVKELT